MDYSPFFADLHIHSHYSRATSRDMNVENLWKWAQLKGITVLGTGDFTHPKWFLELKEKLEPAEGGLFCLRPEFQKISEVPESCRAEVRFMLSAEVSSIYSQNGRTRKVHSLIYSPKLESAAALNMELAKIGNIKSDGRPIIGISAKELLRKALAADPQNVFVPAHAWTPHFSVFGSESGFDSLEECFGELTPQVFALETGLSSDPPMNWQLKILDQMALISNSDAHSPIKLGREANIFHTELSYPKIWDAVRTRDPKRFLKTIEFFPEEGKYHFDGHRNCEMRMTPEETLKFHGACPKCGKPVTVGVLHRVMKLAERPYDPENSAGRIPYENLIPLYEILGECFDCGVGTKKVLDEYFRLLAVFGPEFKILREISLDELAKEAAPIIVEAIDRVRRGNVIVAAGYDGEYGVIQIFTKEERERFLSPPRLF